MVVSRSDTKRRRKEGDVVPANTFQEESPKRAKVHAQRKFAQGSTSMSSSSLTPVKDKAKPNDATLPAKFTPSNRPKTEDFLTFLCFRGTSTLPPRLDFFNVASLQERLENEHDSSAVDSGRDSARNSRTVSSSTVGSQRKPRSHTVNVAVSNKSANPKKTPDVAVQALRKKYQDQRLAKQRVNTLSKLAQKVKGKNMVRTRSATNCEETVASEKQLCQPVKESPGKKRATNVVQPPQTKRLLPNAKNQRGGLRSGGQLPAASSVGLKNIRTRRQILPKKTLTQVKDKSSNKPFISSLSDFSSDDDQPLMKKARMFDKNVVQRGRNVAQEVMRRYAKKRPTKRLKPQIMTRSRLQLTAIKESREKEKKVMETKESKLKRLKEKNTDGRVTKSRIAEEKRKERELKEAKENEVKRIQKLEQEEKERELKEREKIEAERLANELKENKRKEKEKRDKEQKLNEKREKERLSKEEAERVLKEKEAKEIEKLEKKEKEQKLLAIKEKEIREQEVKRLEKEQHAKAKVATTAVSSRPSRKTKEAAAFYMEMLGKRLIDLGDEDDDDSLSLDSFPELPNAKRSEQQEKEIKARAKENDWTPGNKSKPKVVLPTKSKLDKNDVNKVSVRSKHTEEGTCSVESNKDTSAVSDTNILTAQSCQEDETEKLSPTARRRSLRTGSSHSHLATDSSEKIKPKSFVPNIISDTDLRLSESFSDSDEEPLGKLALRKQSNVDKVVEEVIPNSLKPKPIGKTRKSREVPISGMKEALRESITHTPFVTKKENDKPPRAQVMKSMSCESVKDLKCVSEKKAPETDVACTNVLKILDKDQLKREFPTNVTSESSTPVHKIIEFKSLKQETHGLDLMLDKLVNIDDVTAVTTTITSAQISKVESKETTNKDTNTDLNTKECLQTVLDQRNSKGKVNMSTEQIEKWLSESCNRANATKQQLYQTKDDSYQLLKTNQSAPEEMLTLQFEQKLKPPLERKVVVAKNVRETVSKASARMRRDHINSLQPRTSSFKQSLNRAIVESIKDSANLLRKRSAHEKNVLSKDVSPISNLSISSASLSELGESLSYGIRTSRSSEDLRDDCQRCVSQPERTPEKKLIFQRGRPSPQQPKLRKDLKPSVDAFSPENESSVYAFENEPELPPINKPFRRQTTRSSRASSIATSRSEEDLSKLVEDEIMPTTQYHQQSQAFVKLAEYLPQSSAISKSEEFLSTVGGEEVPRRGKFYSQSHTSDSTPVTNLGLCLPHLQDEGDLSLVPSDPVVSDLNVSNTTSTSDEDLAQVRDRLLRQRQVPAHLSLSSTSIAVQVNLDSEDEASPITEASFFNQSLECSTQTEEDEDDNNGHLFYIPLEPGAAGANVTASGMIQGVAVKLGTEGPTGPNQRVIMRAKLVTKPPTFNRAAVSTNQDNNRSLLTQPPRRPINSLLPDLKTCSSSSSGANGSYPPVGTVQPTSRPHTTQHLPQTTSAQQVPILQSKYYITTQSPSVTVQTKPLAVSPTVKATYSTASSLLQSKPSTAYPTVQSKTTSNYSAASQRKSYDVLGSGAALPGTVKWALPHSLNTTRRESKNVYYAQTPDKILVAKKEAFISAVPPLAPLSYAIKKPQTLTNVIAKVTAKVPVTKPSQVHSTHTVTVKEATVGLPTITAARTIVVVSTPKEMVDLNFPATQASSSKAYAGAKRGPKGGWKKARLEEATKSCRVTNKATFPMPGTVGQMVEAPTFYPTEKEFQDPIEFIDRIRPIAEKFGICRIVPPPNFKPECKVSDDMRFTAYNQYVHKTLHRWGPNVKEMMAIRKYLATQNITLKQPPYIGSIEIDLPRLYQTVQQLGGLKEVILKARWHRVADEMKISKSSQDRVTKLDDIYCKYLLPYETLSTDERSKLLEDVELSWNEREMKESNRGAPGISGYTPVDDSLCDDDEVDECIIKGRTMALNQFYRTARNTMNMWFKQIEPPAQEVETEFWRHVTTRQSHVCVHSGSIESSRWGYGFPVSKNSPCAKHSWNLKVLTNNSGSVLRSIGPIMGVTVPTIHVGMLFTTCCWYRDPHGLPWVEYLHTGASKIWYGIPDEFSSQFRCALTKLVPRYVKNKTIWLPSDTAMVPPPLLTEHGVSLSHTVQEPGQFIVVFPKAFTSSICTGYLVSESVYFAQPSWLTLAEQVFKDIHNSCEPSMFSLERLLFSISTDTRSNVQVLKQVLPMIQRVRQQELDHRRQLTALGLKANDRLRLPEASSKKRKPTMIEDDGDYECEMCRANLYVSLVTNSHEEGVYCLPHAIDLLTRQKHQLQYCKLLYTYDQSELDHLVRTLEDRIEMKSQKKLPGKPNLSQLK